DPPPMAEPLSPEELAEEEAQAAADAAELAAARARGADIPVCQPDGSSEESGDREQETEDRSQEPGASGQYPVATETPHGIPSPEPRTLNPDHLPTHHSPATLHNVHNLHIENSPEFAATTAEPCTC